ncbi:hypothetical protein GH714_008369 [Hevea brasiliensis]|uniref:Protein kinase domain-containing protein n=1 Tax=Hevea brasiliensis TaxID=3981 RepID=A0A6A6N2Y8_HEVBR|nr:hypothetical protein GH714_008369 [Hevea brasiliensis]
MPRFVFRGSGAMREIEGSERSEARSFGRSNSKGKKIEGTRGYMSPEFQASGVVTQKCDVYAFGMVVLELVSGEEALNYVFDEGRGEFSRVGVIERAREAVGSGGGGVRSWVDRRLKDSYPVDVAEKMVVVGLDCVEDDPEKRPDMEQVAVRVSKLYLESKNWAEKIDSNSGFVHNHIKSSSILVAEDSLDAKICHFGAAELCGEIEGSERSEARSFGGSNSKGKKIEGTRGYMSPEFQASGVVTQKCDVYAFGVVVLELVSGEEALNYVFDEGRGEFSRVSVIERAREAVGSGGGGVRSWVDRRLKDSYPVDVAEKMVVVGLECVEDDPEKRPDMEQVAVRVSKLYLESKNWAEKIGMPIDFSVSLAPR